MLTSHRQLHQKSESKPHPSSTNPLTLQQTTIKRFHDVDMTFRNATGIEDRLLSRPPKPLRGSSLTFSDSLKNTSRELTKSHHSSVTPGSDRFSHSDIEATPTQKKFLDVIRRKSSSFTSKEFSFLESLANEGEEDDISTAMMVISDNSIFFPELSPVKGKGILQSLKSAFACTDGINVNLQNSIMYDALDYEVEKLRKLDGNGVKSTLNINAVENERSFDNIEIVAGEDGAIVLQDLARSIKVENDSNIRPPVGK